MNSFGNHNKKLFGPKISEADFYTSINDNVNE